MKPKPVCLLLIILALTGAIWHTTSAQNQTAVPAAIVVHPLDSDETPLVDDQAFPAMQIELTPVDAFGLPLAGLDETAFNLSEDGRPVTTLTAIPFTNDETAVSVMIVVDLSAAGAAGLTNLKQAIVPLYETLTPADESGLILFTLAADGAGVNLDEPFPQMDDSRELGFASDEGALINLINAQQIDENAGAPLYDALLKGIRLAAAQARHERRIVLLISDGVDTNQDQTGLGSRYANAETAVSEAQQLGIPVFTIGWGPDVNAKFLRSVAAATGAAYQPPTTPEGIQLFFSSIVNQLRQSYRLGYISQLSADNDNHALVVSLPTGSAPVGVTIPFRAYYPIVPQIRSVTATLPQLDTAVDLAVLRTVKGIVRLEPEIVARGEVTAVNYYVDGSQGAIATASEAPWTFRWDTTALTPGQPHDILIEVIDDSEPPNVGVYETAVLVEACPFFCRAEFALGFDPLLALAAAGLSLLLLIILINRRRPSRPTKLSPMDSATPPVRAPISPPSPEPAAAQSTELLPDEPDELGFLIDVQQQENYSLGVENSVGRSPNNSLVLNDASVATIHARINWLDGQFMFMNMTTAAITKINGEDVLYQPLQDGDRLEIGNREFIFRQVA